MLTKIMGTVTAALAVAVLVQSCRLDGVSDELETSRSELMLCRALNKQTKLDVDLANAASEQCLVDLEEQRLRGHMLVTRTIAEREERENELLDRIKRIRLALEDARRDGNPCSGRLLPPGTDGMLREGTPYQDGDGDGGQNEGGGGTG